MTPDRLSHIVFASVSKADISPALRTSLTCRALQQFYTRFPLTGVMLAQGTPTPHLIALGRN